MYGGPLEEEPEIEGWPRQLNLPGVSLSTHPSPWNLMAHDKRALKGWLLLCRQLPENACRCYQWLSEHPLKPIPGRCFALKHQHYAGAWCYEIGNGQRVYYQPSENERVVIVYYAGPHPRKVPYPPSP